MSEQVITTLLPSLEMAAFARSPDGAFSAVAPAPAWFARIASDTTFPFLGHILEEANMFWQRGTPGASEWGPCAEVDEAGQEFHYKVTAITAKGQQYLVFQLDPGSDRMREVLQKVRGEALSAARDSASLDAVAADLTRTNQEVKELVKQLLLASPTPVQLELLNILAAKCVTLMGGAAKLIRSTLPHV